MIHYFGSAGTWHAIGPLVKNALMNYHYNHILEKTLSNDYWYNIIDLDEWNETRKNSANREEKEITIGRHSRDSNVKWPETKEDSSNLSKR